jgi:hypothetical protein
LSVPFIQTSFASGELTPSLFGHVDLARFHVGAATMRNAFVSYRGGAYSRAGTAFVGFSKQTGRTIPPRLIPFQFSINQGLALEFGNFYMRVILNGAYVTEALLFITGITNSNPGVVSVVNTFSNGDWVFISNVSGMPQINDRTFIVSARTPTTISLTDVYGNNVNTIPYGTYTIGGTITRIFTLVTPYAEADLSYLKFTQSADVMSICCWNQITNISYPAYDLARITDTSWTLTAVNPVPSILPPATCTGATTSSGTTDYNYAVTAISPINGTESVSSPIADIPSAVNIAATYGSNSITWSAVSGVFTYYVYKALPVDSSTGFAVPAGAAFGYAGQAAGTEFIDTNITPDFSQVPPLHINPFAPGQAIRVNITSGGSGLTTLGFAISTITGSGFSGYPVIVGGALTAFIVTNHGINYQPGDSISFSGSGILPTATLIIGPETGTYPSVVAYFQERRVYASSPNNPDTYWMSQPGAFLNFDYRIPTIASDAITGTPWSVEVNGIQFMVSMPGGLVVLTGLAAWQLTGVGGSSLNPQPITPANQQAQPQSYNGCSATVPPIKIDYNVLYVQSKGSIVRNLEYNFFTNIYTGADITQLSSHLFTNYTIREWAWAEEPYKILWAVRNDGILLSLTYLKQQDVIGWARHDTNGLVQSVCSIVEPPVDAVYIAVQRFLPNGTAYLIERMDNRLWNNTENCWCVDAGLAYPMYQPNATLYASSATGLGAISVVNHLIGGANYSTSTTITINDPTGIGGLVTPVIDGTGHITSVTITSAGSGYTNPQFFFVDPTGAGSGAEMSVELDNSATFTSTGVLFTPSSLGYYIRMGGGIAVITTLIDSTHVIANIIQPIVMTIPNSGTPPVVTPALPGTWTFTRPTDIVYGLDYLAGMKVTGLSDGKVVPPITVASDGSVNLGEFSGSAITLGLPFQVQVQSVYLDAGQPTVQGQRKKIAAVTARVEASSGMVIGSNQVDGSTLNPPQLAPIWTDLDDVPNAGTPTYNTFVNPLYTGDIRIPVSGGFSRPGQVAMQQDLPLPMNILAFIPEVDGGDLPQPPGPAARPQQTQGHR